MTLLTGAEAQLAEALAALGQLTGKVDTVLAAFKPGRSLRTRPSTPWDS